ncbi:MAG: MBL fold metallo-hydrolase [Thermoanaerobaculia bacterium]|nr:MBL fold metallo-hydrolase [Thermoanaerobaculia bacterium]
MQLDLGFPTRALRFTVLGSGSAGNCLALMSGRRTLLVDAGFSCRELVRRLESVDAAPSSVAGLVVTHEHEDHCRGARLFARRYGVPIYATAGTLEGMDLAEEEVVTHVLERGERRRIGPFAVLPFAVPHDAREPVGLVLEDASGHRVGLATDIGARTVEAWRRLKDLDVLVLETNHDPELLREGPYPWPLKQRIASPTGHLSNLDAARGLEELVDPRLKWVVLYHLSRTNNLPALAAEAVLEVLDRAGSPARLVISDQFEPTSWLHVHGEEAWAEEPRRRAAATRG